MKNSLLSPSKSATISLLQTAQSRRMQSVLRFNIRPAILLLLLAPGSGIAILWFGLQLLSPIKEINSYELLLQSTTALGVFSVLCALILMQCTIPLVVQKPPKHIAVLPLLSSDWFKPQLLSYYVVGATVLHGIIAGTLAAARLSGVDTAHIIELAILYLVITWLGIAIGAFCNAVAFQRFTLIAITNSLLAITCMCFAVVSRQFLGTITEVIQKPYHLAYMISICIVSLAVTLCLLIASRITALKVPAEPVHFTPPRSGRLANPAMARGLRLHPVIIATIRGLAYDFQSWFFAACMIGVSIVSIFAAHRLNNPIFTAAIITNNAVILPLGFASWLAFARQKLGMRRSSIHTKPLTSFNIVLLQAIPASCVAAALITAITVVSCNILDIPVIANEIARLGTLSLAIILAGYSCGAITYPIKGDQLSVLTTIICTFFCAASIAMIDQLLRMQHTVIHIASLICLMSIVLFCAGIIEFRLQKGIRL